MAFYSDIDADYVSQYRRWHNCEHMPERVSIPGFVEGRRYLGAKGSPGFLMIYETEEVGVLQGQTYLKALDNPTPWTREALTHFRNPIRGIYRLCSIFGESDLFVAPWLLTIRLDSEVAIGPDRAAAVLDGLREAGGVHSARLYEIDNYIATLKTEEKKIYGDNSAYKRSLIFIECKRPYDRKSIIGDLKKGAFSEFLDQDSTVLIDEYSIEYYLRNPKA